MPYWFRVILSSIKDIHGFKFEEPIEITFIKYIPKNDGNNIYVGDEYELLYFNMGEWVSLEKKIARTSSLEFNNIPTNALFWLKNNTKKGKERPFTIDKKGRVIFW